LNVRNNQIRLFKRCFLDRFLSILGGNHGHAIALNVISVSITIEASSSAMSILVMV